jgi:hypothetical protein
LGDNHSIINRGDNTSIIDRGDNTSIIDYQISKVLLPQEYLTLADLRSFAFIVPNTQVIWLSDLSILSVPDEGYSRNYIFIPSKPKDLKVK